MTVAEPTSIDRAQRRIIEEMAGLENNMAKYEYLIDQAAALAEPAPELKTETNMISGCQSSVWLKVGCPGDNVEIRAYSEAKIVRGILGLLLRVLDDNPPGQVTTAELYFLEETGLANQLSPHRANGLESILERIKTRCREYCD